MYKRYMTKIVWWISVSVLPLYNLLVFVLKKYWKYYYLKPFKKKHKIILAWWFLLGAKYTLQVHGVDGCANWSVMLQWPSCIF